MQMLEYLKTAYLMPNGSQPLFTSCGLITFKVFISAAREVSEFMPCKQWAADLHTTLVEGVLRSLTSV